MRREALPVQKLSGSPVLATGRRAAELRRPRGAATSAIGEDHVSAKAVVQRIQRELRGGEEQLPTTVARPPRARGATAHRRGRARRGPRRRDGAAVALLHAGARRRDHGLRHPRPRRLGAPRRLRQRGEPAQPGRPRHRRRVGQRRARQLHGRRSRSRRSTARSCCATSPTCCRSTTSTSSPAPRRPQTDRISRLRFEFELADPDHLDSILAAVKRVDSVYDAARVLPGAAPRRGLARGLPVRDNPAQADRPWSTDTPPRARADAIRTGEDVVAGADGSVRFGSRARASRPSGLHHRRGPRRDHVLVIAMLGVALLFGTRHRDLRQHAQPGRRREARDPGDRDTSGARPPTRRSSRRDRPVIGQTVSDPEASTASVHGHPGRAVRRPDLDHELVRQPGPRATARSSQVSRVGHLDRTWAARSRCSGDDARAAGRRVLGVDRARSRSKVFDSTGDRVARHQRQVVGTDDDTQQTTARGLRVLRVPAGRAPTR